MTVGVNPMSSFYAQLRDPALDNRLRSQGELQMPRESTKTRADAAATKLVESVAIGRNVDYRA